MNNPNAWISLFPYISDAGDGVLDLTGIVGEGLKSGVRHFLVERDLAPNAHETLHNSYQHLAGLRFNAA